MIDHNVWLGFGINRKTTIITEQEECNFGGYLYNTDYIDVDIYDPEYKEISFIHNWVDLGIKNNWIENMGCIKHELKRFNFILDLQNHISMHKELLPETTHIPENKNYFAHQESLEKDVILLFNEGQKEVPTKTIIDIGCGTGKVLELAKDFGYTELYGVDVQKELIEIAKNKIDGKFDIQSAEDYLLPEKQMHIYMFNPFSNAVMEKFLKNNIENIKRNKSCILYNYILLGSHLMIKYGLTNTYNNSFSGVYKFL